MGPHLRSRGLVAMHLYDSLDRASGSLAIDRRSSGVSWVPPRPLSRMRLNQHTHATSDAESAAENQVVN